MAEYEFETWDVFTDRRFGGNPLAVVPDARGLSDGDMQALAREFNLSETTFVLPPADPAHTAHVRIFTPMSELGFAGHPNVGTALALAARMTERPDRMVFEELAGLVPITLSWDGASMATLDAPQPFAQRCEVPVDVAAACAGLQPDDVVTSAHRPVVAGVGSEFILAEVTAAGLARASGVVAAMRDAAGTYFPGQAAKCPVHLYVRDGDVLRTRMFAPLAGIPEDPATGSANVALAALLLSLDGRGEGAWTIHQGAEMGRPSLLHATARRAPDGIRAGIGGGAVPVMRGMVTV